MVKEQYAKPLFFALSYYYIGQITYRLLDQGIANILCLKTLYHGTCLPNYISIRLQGGLCDKGGSETGATKHNHEDDTKGAFFLIKDSQIEYRYGFFESDPNRFSRYFGSGHSLGHLPTFFAKESTVNYLFSLLPNKLAKFRCSALERRPVIFRNPVEQVVRYLAELLPAPLLCFKYEEIPSCFKDDPNAPFAYRIDKDQSPLRIGLLGSLYAGSICNLGWYARFREDPIKPFIGIAEITALAYISKYLVIDFASDRKEQIAMAAGFLLA